MTYLSELHVLKPKDANIVLNPAEGQIVTVSGQRFHLLMTLKIGRKFRIWIRDTATDEVFGSMACHVEEVLPVHAHSKEAFDLSRFLVHFILQYLSEHHLFCTCRQS